MTNGYRFTLSANISLFLSLPSSLPPIVYWILCCKSLCLALSFITPLAQANIPLPSQSAFQPASQPSSQPVSQPSSQLAYSFLILSFQSFIFLGIDRILSSLNNYPCSSCSSSLLLLLLHLQFPSFILSLLALHQSQQQFKIMKRELILNAFYLFHSNHDMTDTTLSIV